MKVFEKVNFIDNIVALLVKYAPQMSDDVRYWVACQFALESNFGTSNRAKKFHNLCGMKLPSTRPSLNIAVMGDFSKFNSDEECVIDYVLWLSYNRFNHLDLFNLSLYTRKLIACKYCPDTNYIDNVFSVFNSFF